MTQLLRASLSGQASALRKTAEWVGGEEFGGKVADAIALAYLDGRTDAGEDPEELNHERVTAALEQHLRAAHWMRDVGDGILADSRSCERYSQVDALTNALVLSSGGEVHALRLRGDGVDAAGY
jgi:hypothetical protein